MDFSFDDSLVGTVKCPSCGSEVEIELDGDSYPKCPECGKPIPIELS